MWSRGLICTENDINNACSFVYGNPSESCAQDVNGDRSVGTSDIVEIIGILTMLYHS